MSLVQRLSAAFGEPIHIDPEDYLEKVLAGVFCRQPDMSGDQRNRLNPKELGAVKKVAACLHAALIVPPEPIPEPVQVYLEERLAMLLRRQREDDANDGDDMDEDEREQTRTDVEAIAQFLNERTPVWT